jgi:hypothetical protein
MEMSSELHVVLGASGASGRAVVQELKRRNLPFRAIGRSAGFSDFEMTAADVFNKSELLGAVQGASHVYLCIGLPYNLRIWQQQWPLLMQNTIEACETMRAKLIFLDNIYMYGPAPLAVPFDEDHPQTPVSSKGIVRKNVADMLLKTMLALTESAFGQVWHLPVGEPVTPEEATEIFNRVWGLQLQPSFMPDLLLRILSFFIPVLKEAAEMQHQNKSTYIMN